MTTDDDDGRRRTTDACLSYKLGSGELKKKSDKNFQFLQHKKYIYITWAGFSNRIESFTTKVPGHSNFVSLTSLSRPQLIK